VHDAAREQKPAALDAVLVPALQDGRAFAGQAMSHPRQAPDTGAAQ